MVGSLDIYYHYEDVKKNGCDKNCAMCDLFLLSREECAIEADRKWEAWAEKKHKEFEKILKGEK